MNNQAIIGAVPDGSAFGLLHWWFGEGVTNTTPHAVDWNWTGGKGTDVAGAPVTLIPGLATGAAGIRIANHCNGCAFGPGGTTQQTAINRVQVDNQANFALLNGTMARFDSSTVRATALSTPQITSDQNDFNPGASNMIIRLCSDASHNLTGLVFDNAQLDGEIHLLINVGSNDIVIAHESYDSAPGNRFHNNTGADITLPADQQCPLDIRRKTV